MTAESLKPFLSAPNAMGNLPQECVDKKSAKRYLLICAFVVLLGLTISVVGLEIWNTDRISTLREEIDSLKQQMHELRHLQTIENLEEFSEFEEAYDSNEVPPGSDEYGDMGEENDAEIEEGSTSIFGIPDSFPSDDMETEISVQSTSNTIDGKRKARSISGMTYQGVPILEESYMNRHNRSRHHQQLQQHHQQQRQRHHVFRHHGEPQFQQMRQREEETAPPPPQMRYKWDDESDRHHIKSEIRRPSPASPMSTFPTTPFAPSPTSYRGEKFVGSPKSSNLVGPDYTTKPPGPTHDRRSRVMTTNTGELNKFQKVIKNPGTFMESRQPSIQKVGRIMRKSSVPVRVTALHLAKSHSRYQNLRATNHVQWQWHPVDSINQEALNSHVFHLSHDGVLTINDTGLYFIYAQVTYSDQHPVNGFSILVNNKRHASCSVHGQHGKKTNTCYTATLADLENGSHIEIRDMDQDHVHLPFQEKTFFGLYKLGRRPVLAHSNT